MKRGIFLFGDSIFYLKNDKFHDRIKQIVREVREMESIILKNGTVLDYASQLNEKRDIKIENRKNYEN